MPVAIDVADSDRRSCELLCRCGVRFSSPTGRGTIRRPRAVHGQRSQMRACRRPTPQAFQTFRNGCGERGCRKTARSNKDGAAEAAPSPCTCHPWPWTRHITCTTHDSPSPGRGWLELWLGAAVVRSRHPLLRLRPRSTEYDAMAQSAFTPHEGSLSRVAVRQIGRHMLVTHYDVSATARLPHVLGHSCDNSDEPGHSAPRRHWSLILSRSRRCP